MYILKLQSQEVTTAASEKIHRLYQNFPAIMLHLGSSIKQDIFALETIIQAGHKQNKKTTIFCNDAVVKEYIYIYILYTAYSKLFVKSCLSPPYLSVQLFPSNGVRRHQPILTPITKECLKC